MITSKNIGILLDFIKNSKKYSDLYLSVKKNSITLSSKRKSNFYIKNNNLESKINISKFYQSILNILLPILRKNKKLVIAQIGQSIDGRIALNNGNSHYINNPKSIIYLHCLRSISDAIIVGSNTIKKDDPLLTTRKIKGTNPKRIIIDGSLSLNNKYKIFNDGNENIIFTKSNKNIRLNNSTIIRLKEKNFTKNFITQIKKLKYKFSDYTSNEISNDHLRHMVGGRGGQSNISEKNERIFNGEFPEKPGALLEFLESFGNQWNISLFHYRNIGSAYGNILIGIEDTHKKKSALLKHLHKCGTAFKEESNNKAYLDFLK